MLDIAPNPFNDPVKKFFGDIKAIKWKLPFIVEFIHFSITLLMLLITAILFLTVGIVSQISTTFWDLIVGMGERMSFSNPIESISYSLAIAIYFILMLPFFILQLPIWLTGWFVSKVGLKIFIAFLIIGLGIYYITLYYPDFAVDTVNSIAKVKDYFSSELNTTSVTSDSVNVTASQLAE